MTNKHNEELYKAWDERWRGFEKTDRLTPIGRLMFRAKKRSLEKAVSNLEVNKVIEVGCGLGHTLEFFQKAGFDCIGIDVSSNAIAACQQKGLSVRQLKLEDLNSTYDLVASDGMLEHFLNFEPYAKHLMRISSRYVMLIQPNHGSFCGKTLVYLAELFRGGENVFEYNYRIQDFIDIFDRNGFKVIKNMPILYDICRLLLFKKK